MDFVRNIGRLTEMKGIRLQQLEEKNTLLDKVSDHRHQCPQTVIDFYIGLTRLNLYHSRRTYKASVLDTISSFPAILAENQSVNTQISHALAAENPCIAIQRLATSIDPFARETDE